MSCFLYENYWGSPTLTLLNVHSVLGVLNVLHVLHTCASCALYAHGRIVGLLGLVLLASNTACHDSWIHNQLIASMRGCVGHNYPDEAFVPF